MTRQGVLRFEHHRRQWGHRALLETTTGVLGSSVRGTGVRGTTGGGTGVYGESVGDSSGT